MAFDELRFAANKRGVGSKNIAFNYSDGPYDRPDASACPSVSYTVLDTANSLYPRHSSTIMKR